MNASIRDRDQQVVHAAEIAAAAAAFQYGLAALLARAACASSAVEDGPLRSCRPLRQFGVPR